MQGLIADIRYSCRTLLRTPSFSAFAVIVLAIGIGANASIFGVVDAVLLEPLQFRDAARLVEVWENASFMGFPEDTPSPGNYAEWKKRNHVFSGMAALKGDIYALTGNGQPEQLEGTLVTSDLFPLLGVKPALGRSFLPEEDRQGGARVIILSASLWARRYGGDVGIVGKRIRMNGEPYQVVGVMPRGFTFPERSDLWIPLALTPRELRNFGSHYLRVFARLKPGISREQASRDMAGLAAQLAREYPDANTNVGAFAVGLRDQLVGNLRLGLLVLAAGVGCVLMIACANVAGLMMARGVERRRDLAVRAALGAGKWRLIRQTLTESLILSVVGGMTGILCAVWALSFLKRLVPSTLAAWANPHLDWRLASFTVAIAAASALVFGLLPALKASQLDLNSTLRQDSRTLAGEGNYARRLLVVGEVVLATTLVAGAGLFLRTLWGLAHVDLGFRPDHVLTLRTNLPVSPETPYRDFAARKNFYERALERVRSIPGVTSAGYTTFLPLTNAGGTSGFTIAGHPPPPRGQVNDANHRVISDGYLQTLGVKLRAGRFFDFSDGPDARPVAIINQAMARQYWARENPLGHRFALDIGESRRTWITIVGVVDNVRQMGLDVEGRAEMYFPLTQPVGAYGYFTPRDLAIRVNGDPWRFAAEARQAVWSVDRNQPVSDVMPMNELISGKLALRDMQVKVLAMFAAIALLLSASGLYGLLAYSVARRTKEIGIRMALGAQTRQVLGTVVSEGLLLIGVGLLGGLLGTVMIQRLFSSLLYGVSAADPAAWAATAVLLLIAGALASYIPALRAASIDPIEALRHE
jgi:putative ABC transport system permease protein